MAGVPNDESYILLSRESYTFRDIRRFVDIDCIIHIVAQSAGHGFWRERVTATAGKVRRHYGRR